MGTNYYLCDRTQEKHCATCICTEKLHIGKSSAGWVFTLRIHPSLDILEYPDWEELFDNPNTYILDEYDKHVAEETIKKKILLKPGRNSGRNRLGLFGKYEVCDYEFS